MFSIFDTVKNSYISNRDFLWLAEYFNGKSLFEFEKDTGKNNMFDSIDKSNLLRFGYFGHGMKLFYDVVTGCFNINNDMIDFSYKDENNVEYCLTRQNMSYNDCIQFKKSICLNSLDGKNTSGIIAYNFGYKCELNVNDIKFNFKPIFKMPLGEPARFCLWIVSNKDLKGEILIKKNGLTIDKIECPLKIGFGTEVNWVYVV